MINHMRLLLFLLSITIAGMGCGSEISSLLGRQVPAASESDGSEATVEFVTPTPATEFTVEPVSANNGLDHFDSYRVNLILDFEGTRQAQPSTGHIESLLEFKRPANALHQYLNVEATIPGGQELAGISEFFKVDHQIFISRGEGVSRFEAVTDGRVTPGEMGFLELDKFIILPSTVSKPPQLERLDGQIVKRYSFDQDDLTAPNITFEQATGDLWVNEESEPYLAQYTISATVKILEAIPNADILDEGTLHLSYKLTDINVDFPITLPENSEDSHNPLADFPPPPDSKLVAIYPMLIEYTSVISPISATLFYRIGLPTRGWSEENAEIFNEKARLTFAKENNRLTVTITPTDDPAKIKIVLDVVSR